MSMSKCDKLFVLNALEDVHTELEELMNEQEWYVTQVVDKVTTAIGIMKEALTHEDRPDSVRQKRLPGI